MVVVLDDLERLVGELGRARELAVERGRRLRERRQSSALEIARARRGCLLRDHRHLVAHDRQVAELPGGARGEEAPLQRRLELRRAQQQLARRHVRLARQCALAGGRERFCGGTRQFLGRLAVELCVQRAGVVEVVRADFEQLLVGLLA